MKKRASLVDLEPIRQRLEQQRQAQEHARHQEQFENAQRQAQANLFQQHMQGVTPLPAHNRAVHPQTTRKKNPTRANDDPPPARFDALLSDDLDISQKLEPDGTNSYRQNGISPTQLKRLRQGHWNVNPQPTHLEMDRVNR